MSIYRPGASAHRDVPTSLYRYYDKYNVLLYVGITSRGLKRNREHNESQRWWRYVARQEVTHLPSRQAALRAEREAIIQMRPPFNRTHNPDHEALALAYRHFYMRAEELGRDDVEAEVKKLKKARKKKAPQPIKKVQKAAAKQSIELPRPVSECTLVPLEVISRDGKFVRCETRETPAKLTAALNLAATPFDRFKAGHYVGSVMSLARGPHGIEMVLKGTWLKLVTEVSAVVHRRDRLIYTLHLTIDGNDVLAVPLGLSDAYRANVGKFSNGALARPLGYSQGGAA